jgi:hypothetical protein
MTPSSLIFPGVVVGVGVALLAWGFWAGGHPAAEGGEAAFQRRQWRRRAATALLTITLGVGLYAIQLVPPRAHPTAAAVLWMLLLFGVLALFGMAAADALASTGYLARLHNRQQAARLALEAELRRARRQLQHAPPAETEGEPPTSEDQHHGNGKHSPDTLPPP